MTTFARDSIADQIERGEVFFTNVVAENLLQGTNFEALIQTGAKKVSLRMTISAAADASDFIAVVVRSNPAWSNAGTSSYVTNMNYASSNTLLSTITYDPTVSYTGGMETTAIIFPSQPNVSGPYDFESGVILKANEDYLIELVSVCANPSYVSLGLFLREL